MEKKKKGEIEGKVLGTSPYLNRLSLLTLGVTGTESEDGNGMIDTYTKSHRWLRLSGEISTTVSASQCSLPFGVVLFLKIKKQKNLKKAAFGSFISNRMYYEKNFSPSKVMLHNRIPLLDD